MKIRSKMLLPIIIVLVVGFTSLYFITQNVLENNFTAMSELLMNEKLNEYYNLIDNNSENLDNYEAETMANTKDRLLNVVQVAKSGIYSYYELEQNGELSTYEAQKLAKEYLSNF